MYFLKTKEEREIVEKTCRTPLLLQQKCSVCMCSKKNREHVTPVSCGVTKETMVPVIVDLLLLLHCLKNRSVHCQGCFIIIITKKKKRKEKEKKLSSNVISLSSCVLTSLPFVVVSAVA
jgi:hypothetical protein